MSPAEAARQQALTTMNVAAIRAWLDTYGIGAMGDDALVLRAAHEARAEDARMSTRLRAESRAWLAEHAPDSLALRTDAAIVRGLRKRP